MKGENPMPLRRPTRRSTAPRRKLVWARLQSSPSVVIPANTTSFLQILSQFQTAYGADPIGATIRRIRGNITMRGGTAGNSVRAVLGIGVFNGVATISPTINPHLDWMYWKQIYVEPPLATEFSVLNNMEIDVKSSRKMEELGQDLYLAISNTHPTDGLSYAYATSTLILLP